MVTSCQRNNEFGFYAVGTLRQHFPVATQPFRYAHRELDGGLMPTEHPALRLAILVPRDRHVRPALVVCELVHRPMSALKVLS